MDYLIILSYISLILALVSIIIGISLTTRCAGKLRLTTIFLIITAFFFSLREIGDMLGFEEKLARNIVHVLVILFILLTLIIMRQMINYVDNYYNSKKKKK